jgi:hypothetical protein
MPKRGERTNRKKKKKNRDLVKEHRRSENSKDLKRVTHKDLEALDCIPKAVIKVPKDQQLIIKPNYRDVVFLFLLRS